MNFSSSFLKLIRLPNLIIVALTQYCIRLLLLLPAFHFLNQSPNLNSVDFFLLVLCTLCIAAAGYVINDYYDVEIDKINKSEKRVLGKHISLKAGWSIYYSLLILGGALAIYLALKKDFLHLLFIYPLANILLFLYAKYLKKMALLGNITVSLFTAFVVIIVFVPEYKLLTQFADVEQSYLLSMGLGLAVFSFLSNFFREIIKDMEDIKGDLANSARTAPIVFGMTTSKYLAAVLLALLGMAIVFFINANNGSPMLPCPKSVLFILFIAPLLFLLYMLFKAKEKSAFGKISSWAKIYMILGIVLLFSLIKYPIL